MTKAQNPEEVATQRVEILSPLLYREMDRAQRSQLIREISEREGISERTLRRWLLAYEEDGYRGLLPQSKPYQGRKSSVTEEIVDEAVMLRREVPTRSIRQIITILEMEGKAKIGEIKRSTLQDHLLRRGYGAKQLQMYHSSGAEELGDLPVSTAMICGRWI